MKQLLLFFCIPAILPAALFSQTGNTLRYDGIDDYVLVADNSSLNMTSAITLEAWMATSSANEEYILTKSDGAYYFGVNVDGNTGKVCVYLIGINDLSGGWLFSTNTYNDGKWHHVAATYDGANERLYVDGNLEGTRSYSGTMGTTTSDLSIGARSCNTGYFGGYIDEVRVWNIARPQDSLIAAKNRILSGLEPGLVGYWPLNESGTTTTASDLTSNGNDGTLTSFALDGSDGWITPIALSGSGTEASPYLVSNYADLKAVGIIPNAMSGVYRLTVDIDASTSGTEYGGAGFPPIGPDGEHFTGTFHGGGHVIANLQINHPSADYVGLFGFTGASSLIDSVGLTGVVIHGNSCVGGLAGLSDGSITDSYTTGTVWVTSSNSGGLVGQGYTVTRCYSAVSVHGETVAGGLVGNMRGKVENSFATGDVTGTDFLGGLAGKTEDDATNCYATGNVTGNDYVSGLVGYKFWGYVTYSYASGVVTGNHYPSGLVSYSYGGALLNSYWNREHCALGFGYDDHSYGYSTTCSDTAGLTTDQMKTQSIFLGAGWAETVWGMDAGFNNGYPYLLWQNPAGTPLPAELTSFTATAKQNSVELAWNTATERNTYGFEVERHATANESRKKWETVGFVAGSRTSNAPKKYSFSDKNISSGKYLYRLKQIDRNGKFTYSHEIEATVAVPKVFALAQNYPNPFNPTTTIEFTLAQDSHVSLKVFDIVGRKVATLAEGNLKAGELHTVVFDASHLSSGVYIYRLDASTGSGSSNTSLVKKLMLMK